MNKDNVIEMPVEMPVEMPEEMPEDVKANLRSQLKEAGVPEEEIGDAIADAESQYRKEAERVPCGPCGDKDHGIDDPDGVYMFPNKPPYFILLSEALHRKEC